MQSLTPNMAGKITNKYKLEQYIGRGGFGNVYKLSDKLVVKEEFKVCNYSTYIM